MSDQNQSSAVGGVSASTISQANAVVSDPTTQAGAVSSNGTQPKMDDTIRSLDDLKKKAPQVYHHMMMGIATNICSEMQHHQERLKQAMRDSYS